MKIGHAFFLVVSSLWMVGVSLGRPDSDKTLHVRVAAYNVEFGENASPEEIGTLSALTKSPMGIGPLGLARL